MSIISIRNLVKTYGEDHQKKVVFNGLNLDIKEHTFVSILGRSGSGKTTLLNLISTLDQYDEGEIVIDGYYVNHLEKETLNAIRNKNIGFVFQEFNLIDSLSVLDNVAIPLLLNNYKIKDARKKAAVALSRVGLQQFLKLKPQELSGGQKQRLAIARAIVNDQKIILCDEPTGALDETTSLEILKLLKDLTKEKTIIMVTHDEEYAKRFSDRMIVLSDGQIFHDSLETKMTGTLEENKTTEFIRARPKSVLLLSKISFDFSNKYLNRTINVVIFSAIVFLLISFISNHFLTVFNELLFGQPFKAAVFKIISPIFMRIVILMMLVFSFLAFLFIFNSIVYEKRKEIAILKAIGANSIIIRRIFIYKTLSFSLSILIRLVVTLFIVLVVINSYEGWIHILKADYDTFIKLLYQNMKAIIKNLYEPQPIIGVSWLRFLFTYVTIVVVMNLEIIISAYHVSKQDTIRVLARE